MRSRIKRPGADGNLEEELFCAEVENDSVLKVKRILKEQKIRWEYVYKKKKNPSKKPKMRMKDKQDGINFIASCI